MVHVFEDDPSGAFVERVGGARRAKSVLERRGVSVRVDETSGDPVTELVSLAAEYDVDLRCLAGRKRTPTGKVVFGRVTQRVILETDRPALVRGVDDR